MRKLVNVAHGDIICRDQLSEDNRLTEITEGFCGLLFLATYVLNLHERVALHLSQTNLCRDLRFFPFLFSPHIVFPSPESQAVVLLHLFYECLALCAAVSLCSTNAFQEQSSSLRSHYQLGQVSEKHRKVASAL